MADERRARPVSGEIMAALGTTDIRPGSAMADIVDAEYEVLPQAGDAGDSRRLSTPSRSAPVPPLEGMDMLRKPDAPTRAAPPARGGPIFWIAGFGAVLAAFWISGGHALIRQSQFLAAMREDGAVLSISGVTSHVSNSGTRPVLLVDGEAGNQGARDAPLPPLQIRVTGEDGTVTRYTLGTSGRRLAPGERFAFSSRLDVPRNGVTAVSVSFAE